MTRSADVATIQPIPGARAACGQTCRRTANGRFDILLHTKIALEQAINPTPPQFVRVLRRHCLS
jgi:hypothetical protein